MRVVLIIFFLLPFCSPGQIFNWRDTTFTPGSYRYFEMKIGGDEGVIRGGENTYMYDTLITFFKSNPTVKAQINIYTDTRGAAKYNMELSKRYARQLDRYLLSNGIDSTSFKTIPKGESEAVYTQAYIDKLQTNKEKEEAYRKNRMFKLIIVE